MRVHCRDYLKNLATAISERRYDSLLLVPGLFTAQQFHTIISHNYTTYGAYKIDPYYGPFRDRLQFGVPKPYVFFLTPRKTIDTTPKGLPRK